MRTPVTDATLGEKFDQPYPYSIKEEEEVEFCAIVTWARWLFEQLRLWNLVTCREANAQDGSPQSEPKYERNLTQQNELGSRVIFAEALFEDARRNQ